MAAAEKAGGGDSLEGDWGPITEIGLPIGGWVSLGDRHPPFLVCRRCGARWMSVWDSRDQIYALVTELRPGAEDLLRADTDPTRAVSAAERDPTLHGTMDRYLWYARYDVPAAVDALLAVIISMKEQEQRVWGSWLGTLEQLMRSPNGPEAAAALFARRDALNELRRPPPSAADPQRAPWWAAFRQRMVTALARATEASTGLGPARRS